MRFSIFTRVLILVLVILICVISTYGYTYYKSVGVVREEIQISNWNRLSFFSNQLDTSVNKLSTILNMLSTDSSIIELAYSDLSLFNNYYNITSTKKIIDEKLRILSLSSNWSNRIVVYAPGSKQMISSDRTGTYDEKYLHKNVSSEWKYKSDQAKFVRFLTNPFVTNNDIEHSLIILEMSFSEDNIITMLDEFKTGGKGDPFLYNQGSKPIVNRTADRLLINEIIVACSDGSLDGIKNKIVRISGKDYLVNAIRLNTINWFLVDYVPLGQILRPINSSRNYFYFSIGLLLLMGILASYMLYRHVQMPIAKLIQHAKEVEKGDFSVRVSSEPNDEFHFLFSQFNKMTEQIKQLIENVYLEQIRSREATLKQLQSQINPHFLYNCLAFIKSMTQLGGKEAVIAMVTSLSKYYRYTTRVENQLTTVIEELDLIQNYLVIQNLQMERIHYTIDVPVELMNLRIPRLILQPIIENSIVHGIEPRKGIGNIFVTGRVENNSIQIVVEDDGIGLNEQELKNLSEKLVQQSLDNEMGTGIWNIHHRLIYQFGSDAGLHLMRSELGGLKVIVQWRNLTEP